MVIQTKSVFKYVLHENIVIVYLYFDELGQYVNKLKICYRSLIFMQFGQHILNTYGQSLC